MDFREVEEGGCCCREGQGSEKPTVDEEKQRKIKLGFNGVWVWREAGAKMTVG